MRDAIGVQIFESVDDFCDEEDLGLFCQFIYVGFDEVDELAAFAIFLHEVEIGLVLEGVLQFVDSWMLHGGQQLFLHHCLIFLFFAL